MQTLSTVARTLYAQLLEDALAWEVALSAGPSRGGVAAKRIGGTDYLYWQWRGLDGRVRQTYLGLQEGAGGKLAARLAGGAKSNQELIEGLRRETAAFVSAGGMGNLSEHFRVVEALTQAGLFQAGAVMVGTHAFVALGNLLGVSWEGAGARTQDIDFARDDAIALALGPELRLDVPQTLKDLRMGFFEVSELDVRQPSTSLATPRGPVKVDFLAPARKAGQTAPIRIPAWNFSATPLRFMDYLLGGQMQRGLYVGAYAVAVTLPHPGRYAVHKVVVSQERPAAFAAKSEKDLAQAAQLTAALAETRPDDLFAAVAAMHLVSGMARRFADGLDRMAALPFHKAPLGAAVAGYLREVHRRLKP